MEDIVSFCDKTIRKTDIKNSNTESTLKATAGEKRIRRNKENKNMKRNSIKGNLTPTKV